jgi:hypothetical protein
VDRLCGEVFCSMTSTAAGNTSVHCPVYSYIRPFTLRWAPLGPGGGQLASASLGSWTSSVQPLLLCPVLLRRAVRVHPPQAAL